MAKLLVHFVVCALSMLVTVVLTSSLLPSVLYALPKALLGCFRGAYSWKLPLFYFGSILIWTILPGAVLSGACYLLRWKSPETLKLVRDSWGFAGGVFAGLPRVGGRRWDRLHQEAIAHRTDRLEIVTRGLAVGAKLELDEGLMPGDSSEIK